MKAGTHIAQEKVNQILGNLGFEYTSTASDLHITIPSWRSSKDISIQEDIAEEVIRIYGYDTIAMCPLGANTGISGKNQMKSLRDISLDFWKHQHWNEVYNYSFTNTMLDTQIGYGDMTDAVGIQNAFNVEYTHMRRSLSVRLLDNIAKNRNIKNDLRFFEIAKVYHKDNQYSEAVVSLLKKT